MDAAIVPEPVATLHGTIDGRAVDVRAGETIVTTGAYGVDEGAHITPVRR